MTQAIYHIARDGAVLGEYTAQQVADKLKDGSVKASDSYWTAGMTEWAPVSLLPPNLNNQNANRHGATPPPLTSVESRSKRLIAPALLAVIVLGFAALIWAKFELDQKEARVQADLNTKAKSIEDERAALVALQKELEAKQEQLVDKEKRLADETARLSSLGTEIENRRKELMALTAKTASQPSAEGAFSQDELGCLDAAQKRAASDIERISDSSTSPYLERDAQSIAADIRRYISLAGIYLESTPVAPSDDSFNKNKSIAIDIAAERMRPQLQIEAWARADAARRRARYSGGSYSTSDPASLPRDAFKIVSSQVNAAVINRGEMTGVFYHVWGEVDVKNDNGAYIRKKFSAVLYDGSYIDSKTGARHEPSLTVKSASDWKVYIQMWTAVPVR